MEQSEILEELYRIWYSIETNIKEDIQELQKTINRIWYSYQESFKRHKDTSFIEYWKSNYNTDSFKENKRDLIQLIQRINMNISYKPARWLHYRNDVKKIHRSHFNDQEIYYIYHYVGYPLDDEDSNLNTIFQ